MPDIKLDELYNEVNILLKKIDFNVIFMSTRKIVYIATWTFVLLCKTYKKKMLKN